jgi:hypothetical protein
MAKTFDSIVVCPKCGSSDFHIEGDTSFIGGDQGFHVCHGCGHSSKFFPEIKQSKVKSFKKQAAKKEKSKPKEKSAEKSKPFFSPIDLAALAVAVIFMFIAGVLGFVIVAGVYFAAKKLIKK